MALIAVGALLPGVGGGLRIVMWNRDTLWRIRLAYPGEPREQHHFHASRDSSATTPWIARLEKWMKLLILAIATAIAAAPWVAGAADATPQPPLQLKPKAAISSITTHNSAPFVIPVAERDLDLLPRRDERLEQSRSSCSGARSLCYDPGSGHIVYKPARTLMPDLPGLQRENISVKRDRIVLRYSF
jgi:hypothetical protein